MTHDSKHHDGIGKKIAVGATGVALVAGAIAAGVALSSKKNRRKLVKGAKKVVGTVREASTTVGREAVSGYQAVAHQLDSKSGRRRSQKRARK